MKFGWLLIGIPLGFHYYGAVGAIIVISVSDIFRYLFVFNGQIRERFGFGRQDCFVTLLMLGLFGGFEWLRWMFGFGTSFETMPYFG